MQITINDEKIDYSLENETNLYDVLWGLRSWLRSEGFVLMAARTDDRTLDLQADWELRGIPIDTVGSLHVVAQTALEKEYTDLAAVGEFFRVLRTGITVANSDKVKLLLEDYAYLHDGLDGVLDRHAIESRNLRAEVLDRIVKESGILETGTVNEDYRIELFAYIDTLTSALAERMREMENPSQELAAVAQELRDSAVELAEVSVMLQTGRDQDAMAAIVRFVERSSRIVRLYQVLNQAGAVDFDAIVVDEITFPAFYVEFNSILSELIDAFTAEDSVLIGDLLEYEISPRLERLNNFIDLLTAPG